MKDWQLKGNEEYFEMVINLSKDGSTYLWPDIKETFIIEEGKFSPTSAKGLTAMKNAVTPTWFKKYVNG